ncbi:MAG: glycosyltransferase family 2 protein [Haliea sp.]|uniref:glycosyltransferase n=1 Tax=Haliea sp. TaxID=1932666 RepID=UPI0032EE684A
MALSTSVIIVSDYASGEDKGWDDLRATLRALAQQDFGGPVEYLLLESSRFAAQLPADLRAILPSLRVICVDEVSSYALKNAGARLASGDILGVLDGDCTPHPGWLRHLVGTFERFPDTAVVSGRTVYNSPSSRERIIGLLSRGYLDRGVAAATTSIANNNAGFTREALLAHPFLDDIGAFGGKLQAESMRQAGLQFRFEPGMLAAHAYEGWGMERDIRCHSGFATVMVRKIDSRIAHAWLCQLGTAGVPCFFLGRLLLSWGLLLRLWRHYDVPLTAIPRGLGVAVYLHWLEIPGMRLAFRGARIEETAYR